MPKHSRPNKSRPSPIKKLFNDVPLGCPVPSWPPLGRVWPLPGHSHTPPSDLVPAHSALSQPEQKKTEE